jgi:predicted transcriptional regulator
VLKAGEKMKISELTKIGLQQVNYAPLTNDIEKVYIGDMLSFVMANGQEGTLWLTVQKHANVIAVAQLNDFAGIIFVQGNFPNEDTIDKANEFDIPLFVSDKDAYQVAKDLMSLGL